MDPLQALTVLWQRCRDNRIAVTYEKGVLGAGEYKWQHRCIWIFRDPVPIPRGRPDPGVHVVEDLLTLSHEFGHALSHARALRGEPYEQASVAFDRGRLLTPAQEEEILREERRAWDLAAETLSEIGFCPDSLQSRPERSLAIYEVKFRQQRAVHRHFGDAQVAQIALLATRHHVPELLDVLEQEGLLADWTEETMQPFAQRLEEELRESCDPDIQTMFNRSWRPADP